MATNCLEYAWGMSQSPYPQPRFGMYYMVENSLLALYQSHRWIFHRFVCDSTVKKYTLFSRGPWSSGALGPDAPRAWTRTHRAHWITGLWLY